MKIPLYLDIVLANRVMLDGESLRVETHDRVDARYPLLRLARVVVTGPVDWETAALLACLRSGVPVAFRERSGELIGHCLNDRCNRVNLEILLSSAIGCPGGERIYQLWLAECWDDWCQRAMLVLEADTDQAGSRDLQAKLLYALESKLPCDISLFRDQACVLISSHLTGVLLGYGFSDNVHVPLTALVHPLRDLHKLLEWDLLLRVVAGQPLKANKERGLRYTFVCYFQQCDHLLEQQARCYLNILWRRLKENEVD